MDIISIRNYYVAIKFKEYSYIILKQHLSDRVRVSVLDNIIYDKLSLALLKSNLSR